ncbi:MAG: outer membrane protein transport protein [Desulfobacterales bacterium]|nr:outer membrane protein transport protein [Desulfobacterales bacterium]
MKKTNLILIQVFVLCFLISGSAWADLFDTYGFGAKGMAMGGALCASVDDSSGIYYNPAGLGDMKREHYLGFSYLYTMPSMTISGPILDTPKNSDLAMGMIVIDMAFDINKVAKLPVPVTFGLGLSLKDDLGLVNVEDVDESRPRFLQFGSALKRTNIYMGVGSEIFKDFLWFGAGAHAMIGGKAVASLGISAEDLSTDKDVIPSEQDIWMDLKAEMNPIVGFVISPIEDLKLGFSYKDDIAVDIDPFNAPINLHIGDNVATITAYTAILAYWNPKSYRAGASYTLDNLTIEFDIVLEQWSDFKRNVPYEMRRSCPKFDDIILYRIGVEKNLSDIILYTWERVTIKDNKVIDRESIEAPSGDIKLTNVKLWGGYQFVPSPVPEQTGASNYLDCDRHIVSFGCGAEFKDPFGIVLNPIGISFAFQDQYLPERKINKEDSSYNYTVNGNVMSCYFSLKLTM